MIYNKSKPGTEDSSVGNAFEQSLIKGLEDKYPCVDWMNEQALADAIQKLREQEALTGELDEKALAALGQSVGATYIIIVRVFTLGNGQTVVSARVIDGKGASTLADQMENAASGDAAYNAARSVAQKILQDLSSKFGNQCDAHWTGTITFTTKTLREEDKNSDYTKIEKVHSTLSEKYEDKIEVTLQSMSKGGKMYYFTNGYESMVMSRVARTFSSYYEMNLNTSGVMNCRPRGATSYRKEYKSTYKKVIDERGANTEAAPVEIKVLTDRGTFDIKVPTPAILIKTSELHTGLKDDCVPKPIYESNPRERTDDKSLFWFDGQVDPKNPNVLVGKKVTGTLDQRQQTITWNLRLMQPKKKR